MGKYQGSSRLALRPSTTDEVSQLLAYCSLRRLAVVPQAGNTGLVGGSVPVFDEIILNMSSMNKLILFDEVRAKQQAEAFAAAGSSSSRGGSNSRPTRPPLGWQRKRVEGLLEGRLQLGPLWGLLACCVGEARPQHNFLHLAASHDPVPGLPAGVWGSGGPGRLYPTNLG